MRPLRLYCSAEAHFSIEKGAIVAGVGKAGVRRIGVDDDFRMSARELEGAIAEDRARGFWPFCVVATLGTTSSTSVDPVGEIAEICRKAGVWLHVDAAYGGAAAVAPEYRTLLEGWERADSIVVNPHKWLFTPFDASLLLFRRGDVFREAFSLVPDYVRASQTSGVHNYNEYGIQMGRRFRALKVWMLIRYFGVEGLAARIREHCRMATELASWIDADPDWERLAPVPFSTVCLRFRPASLRGTEDDAEIRTRLDAANAAILERVNRTGRIYLSGTRLKERFTIRVTLGNPRTTPEHVARAWDLLRAAARETAA